MWCQRAIWAVFAAEVGGTLIFLNVPPACHRGSFRCRNRWHVNSLPTCHQRAQYAVLAAKQVARCFFPRRATYRVGSFCF